MVWRGWVRCLETMAVKMSSRNSKTKVIVPGANFSCSGRVLAWVFGAQWRGGLELFTELQIWRPVSGENGSYAKVGSTTIL